MAAIRWLREKLLVVLGTAATTVIIVGVTSYETGFLNRHHAPRLTFDNTELVLDTSAGMASLLHDRTKLEVASDRIKQYVDFRGQDTLGLRSFGGPCKPGQHLLVPLGAGEVPQISRALDEQRPEGRSALASALIAATGDFEDLTRFPARASTRIVIVTGDADDCDRQALADVRERMQELRRHHVDVEFWIIGMTRVKRSQRFLSELAGATGGAVLFASNPTQLSHALRRALVAAPVVQAARKASARLGDVAEQFKIFAAALQRGAAASLLKQLTAHLKGTDSAYNFLLKSRPPQEFPALIKSAAAARHAAQQQILLARRALTLQRQAEHGSVAARSKLSRIVARFSAGYDVYIQKAAAFSLAARQLGAGTG